MCFVSLCTATLLTQYIFFSTEIKDPQEKVNLFKYLPEELTGRYVVVVLEIEKNTIPKAGVSKLLKDTLVVCGLCLFSDIFLIL